MATIIAQRYATALFDAARESETTDAATVLQEMKSIEQALYQVPAFQHFLATPVISEDEKKDFLRKTLQDRVSPELHHFMLLLVDKRRVSYFGEMVKVFQQHCDAMENRVNATAVTAVPMSDEALKRLKESLGRATGKTVTLENQVDRNIVGGVKVRVGSRIIDGTVQNQLGRLKEELLHKIVSSEG